jgi:thioredoxin 1
LDELRMEMQMSKPIELTDAGFSQDVERAKGVTLVDFWAAWCGPCRMIAPVVEQIANENEGKLRVGKLDVDHNQVTAGKYGVMSIPTLILFKDGRPVERLVGYLPKDRLFARIKPYLN